jgi:peptidoglycan hydrolase-like protein with peptidoglycan-binding domain
MARREPSFDDLCKAPRRKRKPARTGLVARFGARGIVDSLAVLVAAAAIGLVFVNALGLQKAPNGARGPQLAAPKAAAPTAVPLPQPRPDSGNARGRTDLMHDVQAELASRGYYDGAIDGAAGPRISQAIRDFEQIERLRVTGEPSETLLGQIRKAGPKSDVTGSIGPANPPAGNPQVLSVQRVLARYGYGPVHMNGASDRETREAIERFERDREMPQTGEISERLLRALVTFNGGALD